MTLRVEGGIEGGRFAVLHIEERVSVRPGFRRAVGERGRSGATMAKETCREGMAKVGDLSSPPRDVAMVAAVGGDG